MWCFSDKWNPVSKMGLLLGLLFFQMNSSAYVPDGEPEIIIQGYQEALEILEKVPAHSVSASNAAKVTQELIGDPIVEALDSWCHGNYAFTLRAGAPAGYIHRRKIYMCPTPNDTPRVMAQAMIHEALHIILRTSNECRVDKVVKAIYRDAGNTPLAFALEAGCGF